MCDKRGNNKILGIVFEYCKKISEFLCGCVLFGVK